MNEAKKAEESLLIQESNNIAKMINQKVPAKDIKTNLVSKIRAIAAANESTFDSLVAENLESLVNKRDFDKTEFLAQKNKQKMRIQ